MTEFPTTCPQSIIHILVHQNSKQPHGRWHPAVKCVNMMGTVHCMRQSSVNMTDTVHCMRQERVNMMDGHRTLYEAVQRLYDRHCPLYEAVKRQYDGHGTLYESVQRQHDGHCQLYEAVKRQYDGYWTLYVAVQRQYNGHCPLYEALSGWGFESFFTTVSSTDRTSLSLHSIPYSKKLRYFSLFTDKNNAGAQQSRSPIRAGVKTITDFTKCDTTR